MLGGKIGGMKKKRIVAPLSQEDETYLSSNKKHAYCVDSSPDETDRCDVFIFEYEEYILCLLSHEFTIYTVFIVAPMRQTDMRYLSLNMKYTYYVYCYIILTYIIRLLLHESNIYNVLATVNTVLQFYRWFASRSLWLNFYNSMSIIDPFRKQLQITECTKFLENYKHPTKSGVDCNDLYRLCK